MFLAGSSGYDISQLAQRCRTGAYVCVYTLCIEWVIVGLGVIIGECS